MTTDIEYNKSFILECIHEAVNNLTAIHEFKSIKFDIQEGTTGESGSVQVASKIADERIPNCDVFIADLSVVNHINKIGRFIQNLFGHKYKPFQNNNVLYEYGVAYGKIGEERIIGILNSTFGSPNENPDNIPFDLKHLKHPIEYKYSSKSKERLTEKDRLVSKLTDSLKRTSAFALLHQKDKYKPLLAWEDWELQINTSQRYYKNEIINNIVEKIKGGVDDPTKSIRLLGLSGLGKTRILFEAFRASSSPDSINLNSRILYINYSCYSTADYQVIFTRLIREKENRIVIIDNCPSIIHRQLLHFIRHENNTSSLITIDSNPEEIEQDKINGVNYIIIKKEDLSSIVDQILKDDFSGLEKDKVEKIKEFSQGIPLMAVLIAESLKNGEKFIGKLDDKELLDNLLGEKGKDIRFRTILKSCSIFNYFGIEGDLKTQLEFIAKDKYITSLDGDDIVLINDFHEACNHFLKREIFEKKGRLIGLRPFPLAISLAQEWLESCTSDRLLNVIANIAKLTDPDRKSLSEAFAEQMKYLNYNDKAILIIEKIVGPGSPFDNAEVLNSELGSRLFRSFVEVNPVAISRNLARNFSSKTKEELIKVNTGRRNLVWVLDKLCFDKRTFKESAKILYSFAISENETWANNATGQFLHLFKIFLAGTESNLNERWEIIRWGLSKDDEYKSLAVKAMKSGLDYGHFSRMEGAEHQGNKKLIDYQPNWEEVKEYWIRILAMLTEIIKSNDINSKLASDSIANSIRSICNARLGHIVVPFVEEIAIHKNYDWNKGLEGLKYARKYEKALMSEDLLEKISELIKALTKTDFRTRYATISSSYYLDNDETYSSDKVKEAIINLANEFIDNEISWESNFSIFYTNQQIYSYFFGQRVFDLIKDRPDRVLEFIQLSFKIIIEINKENRNVTVLGGFISQVDIPTKKIFYTSIFDNSELSYLLFYFLSIDINGKDYYHLLFELIDSEKCELSNFNAFNYSESLRNCSNEELKNFSEKLFAYGEEGYALVFSIYFNLQYNNDQFKTHLIPIFKECINKLGMNYNKIPQIDNYKWSETICSILDGSEDSQFAKYINESVIESITWENSYHLDHYMQKIYEVLIRNFFQIIWSDLSAALLSVDKMYIKFYGLKHILGSNIGGVGKSVGILFDGDLDLIFNWCKSNQPLAPARIAELVPIYGNNNTEYSMWHPIAKRLIDEFGGNKDVLEHLTSNIGTYSWTGSVVPLLESQKQLFESIKNHPILLVSEWAAKYLLYIDRQIEQEKNRDEEMYL